MKIISRRTETKSKTWSIKSIITAALTLSLVASLTSCGAKSASEAYYSKTAATMDYTINDSMEFAEMETARMSKGALMEESISPAEAPAAPAERKLIKTGNISVEVQSLKEGEQTLYQLVKEMGGYVTDTWTYSRSYNATIKIPAEKFDEAMSKAGTLGKIKNRGTNTQDVTDQYYDLETRISTKITMQKKFQEYLSQASDIKDLLEIERQLNQVTSEIEVMQGQFNRLSNQISYSTISVNMELPYGNEEEGFVWPDMKEKFREFGTNLVEFMAWLVMAFFYIIVFGIPLVAIIAFFYWLLLGKVGLLRKLFSRLHRKQEK